MFTRTALHDYFTKVLVIGVTVKPQNTLQLQFETGLECKHRVFFQSKEVLSSDGFFIGILEVCVWSPKLIK